MAVEKIELHRPNFPYGTVGFDHFPDVLEGRLRHSSIFSQPLERLPYLKFRSTLLGKMGIVTLSNLLNTPSDQFKSLPKPQRRSVQENLASFIEEYLVWGPEDHLLRAILGTQVILATPEVERERNALVAEVLDDLDPFKKELLTVHFGLADGLPKSLEATARQLGRITTKRPSRLELFKLSQIEGKMFLSLRHDLIRKAQSMGLSFLV